MDLLSVSNVLTYVPIVAGLKNTGGITPMAAAPISWAWLAYVFIATSNCFRAVHVC